ncbi:MAG: FAD:protein FMN transferase [Thermoguttaceae bacterium]|nr:FAD:protein FMN transferase [Thermoguttaceae bacterium]
MKYNRLVLVTLFASLAVLNFGCGRGVSRSDAVSTETPRRLAVDGLVMGTFWNVKVYVSDPKWNESELTTLVQTTLDGVDRSMSTYKEESELSRFNRLRTDEWFEISAGMETVVALALEVSRQTNGAFDVTVGPLVNLWRFGPDKSPLAAMPSDARIAEVRKNAGFDKLELRHEPTPAIRKKNPDLYVDLSAIAKGYAVDCLANKLVDVGIESFMIDVGGEVRCRGYKPAGQANNKQKQDSWTLGIESPRVSKDAPSQLHRTVCLDNQSLATSGDYRNYLQVGKIRFSHLIDPRTGKPVEMISEGVEQPKRRLGSVSVLLDSCARADAFATAFFVLGAKDGVALADQLDIPVLFVSRLASGNGELVLEETMSQSFRQNVRSETVKNNQRAMSPSGKRD